MRVWDGMPVEFIFLLEDFQLLDDIWSADWISLDEIKSVIVATHQANWLHLFLCSDQDKLGLLLASIGVEE